VCSYPPVESVDVDHLVDIHPYVCVYEAVLAGSEHADGAPYLVIEDARTGAIIKAPIQLINYYKGVP
jgi:predicted nucleic acid-binding protein